MSEIDRHLQGIYSIQYLVTSSDALVTSSLLFLIASCYY